MLIKHRIEDASNNISIFHTKEYQYKNVTLSNVSISGGYKTIFNMLPLLG